ncbi:Spy/CpxP family protein refolding chaperone [Bradyrhizobium guangxiense]|uniref:Spy/CpxP family protein refolding chaperone n=1 Tax=Bradyrhizobium guangxiense TaxID=1325115 RepID=UPI00100936D4|nr:Spy/CpxP family protein refolding chaperone [Bradyrhizobium guangxiense]
MLKFNQIIAVGALSIATAMFSAAAPAQRAGPGVMGPGMMMGPGFMGHGGPRGACGPAAASLLGWRIDRIEQVIKPTETQRAKFDDLKAASDKASAALRLACPTEVPTTTVSRMEFMERRMEAMLQSIKTVRPAFESFYETLSDEQKARLDSPSDRNRFWRHLW